MNMWGFTPRVFGQLREHFHKFLERCVSDVQSESYLPSMVNDLVVAGQARVKVLRTKDSWGGITYRADRPRIAENIQRLIDNVLIRRAFGHEQVHDIAAVARRFQIDGQYFGTKPFGSGHINDSYCVTFHQAGEPVRYMLQRINQSIFKNPVALMENIQRVTSHLAAKVSGEPDCNRLVLTLISARDERVWHLTDGNYWRAYRFIEGAHL
jgi:hypothetical protein